MDLKRTIAGLRAENAALSDAFLLLCSGTTDWSSLRQGLPERLSTQLPDAPPPLLSLPPSAAATPLLPQSGASTPLPPQSAVATAGLPPSAETTELLPPGGAATLLLEPVQAALFPEASAPVEEAVPGTRLDSELAKATLASAGTSTEVGSGRPPLPTTAAQAQPPRNSAEASLLSQEAGSAAAAQNKTAAERSSSAQLLQTATVPASPVGKAARQRRALPPAQAAAQWARVQAQNRPALAELEADWKAALRSHPRRATRCELLPLR